MIRTKNSGYASKKQKENILISPSKESPKSIFLPFEVTSAGSSCHTLRDSWLPAQLCQTTTSSSRIQCLTPAHVGYSGLSQPVARTFTLRTNNWEMPPAAYQALGQGGKGLPSPSSRPGLGETGVNPEECGMLSQAGRTASSSQLQHSATREHLPKQKLPVLGQLLTGATAPACCRISQLCWMLLEV